MHIPKEKFKIVGTGVFLQMSSLIKHGMHCGWEGSWKGVVKRLIRWVVLTCARRTATAGWWGRRVRVWRAIMGSRAMLLASRQWAHVAVHRVQASRVQCGRPTVKVNGLSGCDYWGHWTITVLSWRCSVAVWGGVTPGCSLQGGRYRHGIKVRWHIRCGVLPCFGSIWVLMSLWTRYKGQVQNWCNMDCKRPGVSAIAFRLVSCQNALHHMVRVGPVVTYPLLFLWRWMKRTTYTLQATVLDARASRVKWPAQFMSHWYGILFTE